MTKYTLLSLVAILFTTESLALSADQGNNLARYSSYNLTNVELSANKVKADQARIDTRAAVIKILDSNNFRGLFLRFGYTFPEPEPRIINFLDQDNWHIEISSIHVPLDGTILLFLLNFSQIKAIYFS